jgi:N-acetylglutamate synthase-like GNAT family acetyltransferase
MIFGVCYNAPTRFQSSEDKLNAMQIRLATIDDIPALRQLIEDSVRGLSVTYYSPQQIESALHDVFGVDTQLILDETYFIAEVDAEIVGAGGWSKRTTLFGGDRAKSDRVDSLLNPEEEPARIRAFYIHPDWSRRGIGSLILDACEQAARVSGFKNVELASTLPGVPFYLSRGYKQAEAISIPMAGGETLITYRMTSQL